MIPTLLNAFAWAESVAKALQKLQEMVIVLISSSILNAEPRDST